MPAILMKHTLLAAARELFRIAQLRLTMPTKKKVDKKTSMQINREEKDPRGEQRNAPANKFDNNYRQSAKNSVAML
ncbi:hypothetical protein GLYMA_13G150800v4 [Glycine max]|uniref:Uncharacterized protein n=1 Tax=Glycine max TaxID=3847 RepID=A0A0R0GP02_SOYBN|nr:hypothetical protein GYH30_036265 [Glycine max]KAH1216910.1 hypothetical protein GmHk_13G037676 [Glycine max]KRH20022.1 hypothetical protein GLYMA_13G150800v4 [Glycine max]